MSISGSTLTAKLLLRRPENSGSSVFTTILDYGEIGYCNNYFINNTTQIATLKGGRIYVGTSNPADTSRINSIFSSDEVIGFNSSNKKWDFAGNVSELIFSNSGAASIGTTFDCYVNLKNDFTESEKTRDSFTITHSSLQQEALFAIRHNGQVYVKNLQPSNVNYDIDSEGNMKSTIGSNGNAFTDAYITNINGSPYSGGSDRALKKSIYSLNDSYDSVFDALIPKRFKYKEDTQMGSAYKDQFLGFIAQDVKKALDDNNITSQTIVNGEEGNYALSYMQFIPLNTWQIQKLKKRVSDLEERLAKLENKE